MSKAMLRALEAIVAAANPAAELRLRLERERAADKRKAEKTRPRRQAKVSKRQAARDWTAEIRSYVALRDTFCVACLRPCEEPWELHHADSGSGKTQRQSIYNCVRTHLACHRAAHAGDLEKLGNIRERFYALWITTGCREYTESVAVLDHRIDKVLEARAQHPARTERSTTP